MQQSDTRASRSMDMDGLGGGLRQGKIGLSLGGIMMRSTIIFSSALPVVDLPCFGVFTVASFCFSHWGAVDFAVYTFANHKGLFKKFVMRFSLLFLCIIWFCIQPTCFWSLISISHCHQLVVLFVHMLFNFCGILSFSDLGDVVSRYVL
jgi:hypothetical protein